jgi:hypothetical protein
MGFSIKHQQLPPAEELGCGSGLPSLCALALGRLRVSKLFVGIENHTEASFGGLNIVAGWRFGTFFIFPYIGIVIIPSDSYFSEGLFSNFKEAFDMCVLQCSQPARIFPPI